MQRGVNEGQRSSLFSREQRGTVRSVHEHRDSYLYGAQMTGDGQMQGVQASRTGNCTDGRVSAETLHDGGTKTNCPDTSSAC